MIMQYIFIPGVFIMITIIHCGHDSKHKTKFHMTRKTGVPNYILLLVKTEAFFEIDGVITRTQPNMAVLYDRNTYMNYGCDHASYNDDWIHFDFIDEPSLVDMLNIPLNKPVYLPYMSILSNYARMLVQESYNNSLHRNQIQDSLMRILLYNLDNQLSVRPEPFGNQKHYLLMNQLRINIHNTPHKKRTAEAMAGYVNLSVSYFQHLYKALFGITCVQEIILARLERAKFYLSTTDMPVVSISEICGYESDLHFMRQFKKFEGLTPTQYRHIYTHTSV